MKLMELKALVERRIRWERWETIIRRQGITIDRPCGSRHPDHPSIIYPIDYGFVNETQATDGHELDLFCGTAETGLVGTMITIDYRKHDREFKLLYNCSAPEIYLVNGFINYDRRLMEGLLVLRRQMDRIWEMTEPNVEPR